MAEKSLKSILSSCSWSPASKPVVSYRDRAAPCGWDVGALPLLHRQGPELTGTGIAAQFCLISQLERWWSVVWEKCRQRLLMYPGEEAPRW